MFGSNFVELARIAANMPEERHSLQPEFCSSRDMREAYDRAGLLPTSERADVFLIRSHVAYWSGQDTARRVGIKPSRGHSYRITDQRGQTLKVVRITDHYDHRNGVEGWN